MFNLPEKTEEALVYDSFLDCCLEDKLGRTSCLIALKPRGWLVFHSLRTGEIMKRIYLSHRYKFCHLTWETDFERIVVKSIRRDHPLPGLPSHQLQPFVTFAVFSVGPLELIGLFHIYKQIFGSDLVDATINQSMLVIYRRSGLIEFYDFELIVREHTVSFVKLFEPFVEDLQGVVGEQPLGIPCSIRIPSRPPLLCQIQSHQNHVAFGGFPYHYIQCPSPKHRDLFHVCSLQTHQLIENGQLERGDFTYIEDDCAFFHPDQSNSVMHVRSDSIQCHDIVDEKDHTELRQRYSIDAKPAKQNKFLLSSQLTTSSGRRVRKLCDIEKVFNPIPEPIQAIDYEDELQLFIVTSTIYSDDGLCAQVQLCDKDSGHVCKRILLKDWHQQPFSEHRVVLDRDVLIHLVRQPSHRYDCYVYRLHGNTTV